MIRRAPFWVVCLILATGLGCSKDENTPAAPAPPATTNPPNPNPPGILPFMIYTDDLQSGGGAFLYPGGDNQALSFNDTSGPSTGQNNLRYFWNGDNVTGQHAFAGFDLSVAGDVASYNTTPPRDMSGNGFQSVRFDARGSLGADVVVKIEAADDGSLVTRSACLVLSVTGMEDDSTPGNPSTCPNKATLLPTWQNYTIPVTTAHLSSVKDYFKATYIYKAGAAAPAGNGGTLFLDQIYYE